MKRTAFVLTLLAVGLLSAGCGAPEQPGESGGGSPPAGSKVTPSEQPPAPQPGEMPEESAQPPAAGEPEGPQPSVEGPAFPAPPAAKPAPEGGQSSPPAAKPAPEGDQSSAPAAKPRSAATPASQQSVVGAVGKSLFRAVTGGTGDTPQPTFGDAPQFEKPH